jgi:PAS domain S-box-containing protein
MLKILSSLTLIASSWALLWSKLGAGALRLVTLAQCHDQLALNTPNCYTDIMNTQNDINPLFFDSILNSIADPVFVKDSNFQFVYANDALCKMLGINRENIIGKTLGESLPEDQMTHFLEIDKNVIDSGQANTSEELLTGKDGKILNIITKKTRYIDEKGNKFVVGIIRDNTERKIAEETIQKKITELENMNKLMMGRELKMVELKKEIEVLKKP